MDKIMHTMKIVSDKTMEQAYQTYSLLNEEVRRWQDERGSFWMDKLIIAETPPYYPLRDFPEILVLELWKRLNQVRGVLVSEAVLSQTWHDFNAGLPVSDLELLSRLQIALTGIAHLSHSWVMEKKRDISSADRAESSDCPICGEGVALSVLTAPNGKRCLHCTLCGYEWSTTRVGCILCGREEASDQNYLNSGEFPGIEVVACEACGQYFKELDLRILSVEDFVWEDVRTLPLNYAAEQWFAEQAKIAKKVQ
ncbi:formate dehydrogenase accessory protein FdhE [Desulfosporosinus fructosivorans]